MKKKIIVLVVCLLLSLAATGQVFASALPDDTAPTSTVGVVEATTAPTAVTAGQAASNQQFNASWVLVILGLALLFVLYFNRWNARPKPTAEQCAQCGFDLTGKSGPCPQCGGTRRLPKLH